MTFYTKMHKSYQELWSIPASEIHCENKYIEPGSKTKTVRKKGSFLFLPQFSSSDTQNLSHRVILETSKLKV